MVNVFHILADLFKGGISFALVVVFILILRKLLRILIKNTVARKKVLFFLPVFEFLLLFAVLISTAFSLITKDQVIGLIIVLILLLSVSKFLKNYISGIVFRLTNRDITGSMVEIEGVSGRVSAYLMTSIAIKNQKDEVIKIPYTSFYNKYKTASINTENTVKISLVFSVESKEAKAVQQKIRALLINSMYVVLTKEIKLNYSLNTKRLEVNFYSLSDDYKSVIQQDIEALL